MTKETITTENKMGVMPIPKLLTTMGMPMVLSMLVQALYNIVDSMFVSHLNETKTALNAITLVFPIQVLIIAIAAGTGVGINALASKHLGSKHFREANQVAQNGLFLAILSAIVIAIAGGIFSHSFIALQLQGLPAETSEALKEEILTYGTQYMQIITIFSFGCFLQITFEKIMQSTGQTIYNMITQGAGAIINIILDPIFIFGMFGVPKMEAAGAAIATVTGQIIAAGMGLWFCLSKNRELTIRLKGFRPNPAIIKAIYKIGLPSIFMQSISSVLTFFMNIILSVFSATAVSVFGVFFKLQNLFLLPVYGLINATIPIVAYNYGARHKKRILHTIQLSVILATGFMAIGFVLFQTAPEFLLSFFDADQDMVSTGISALRTMSFAFLLAGYCITASASFQALGNGIYSLIVSSIRQLMVILPLAYLFSRFFSLAMVWWALPIAEVVGAFLCTLFLLRIYRKKIYLL